jgi:SAM-dependent methyltransferase
VSFDYQWRNLSSPSLEYTEKRIEELLDYTGLKPGFFMGKRCLDAGCGTGRWTWAMFQMGGIVDSFDVSDEAVNAARSVNPRSYVGDITALQPPGEYDFVLCWGVLHHMKEPIEGFRRVVSQVKSGGHLHIMVYHRDTQRVYEAGRKKWPQLTEGERLALCREMVSKHGGNVHGWWNAFNPTFNWSFHHNDVKKWFEDAGFRDIRLVKKYNINLIGCKK